MNEKSSGRFACIPDQMLRFLSGELIRLYGAIRLQDWEKEGEVRRGCTLELEQLGTFCGVHVRQVQRNLAKLEQCRAVRVETGKRKWLRIFCTPEAFDPGLLNSQSVAKSDSPDDIDDVTSMTQSDTHDVKPVTSMTKNDTHDATSVTSMTQSDTHDQKHDMDDVTPPSRIARGKELLFITKHLEYTPGPPKVPQTDRIQAAKPESAAAPKTPDSTWTGHDIYALLRVLKEAAGDTLSLGELIPSSSAPEGFSGVLRIDVEAQLQYKLQGYAQGLFLTQAELSERLKRLGAYLASKQCRYLRSGVIALRALVNPKLTLFEEIMDEALGKWQAKTQPSARASPAAAPSLGKMLFSDQANAWAKSLDAKAFAIDEKEKTYEKPRADW